MKDKILFLIIGFLIGAIIATSAFLIYSKSVNGNQMSMPEGSEMGEPPEKPSGEMGEPPEKPSGETGDNNQMQEPPEKPENPAN